MAQHEPLEVQFELSKLAHTVSALVVGPNGSCRAERFLYQFYQNGETDFMGKCGKAIQKKAQRDVK